MLTLVWNYVTGYAIASPINFFFKSVFLFNSFLLLLSYFFYMLVHIHIIMSISNLFSDEKVNTGRQVELDIAKGLAIIFMIFLHTIMVVQAYNAGLSPSYNFIFSNVLGRPYAAVIFMFSMGVGVVYSRHSQWDTMVKRGVKLYLLGILVNVFEFFIPHFLAVSLGIDASAFPLDGG